MAETPPDRPIPTIGASAASGADLSVTEARGAVRTGRNIWILVISIALAVVLLLGYWLMHAPHMAALDHPHVSNAQAVSTFNTPAGSARQAPPGEPSTEGNSQ